MDIPAGSKQSYRLAWRSASLAITIIIALFLLFYSTVSFMFSSSRDFGERYKQIELRNTREALDSTMEREPDLNIRFLNRVVLYYEQVGMEKVLTGGVIGEYENEEVFVETLADLPYFYGAVLVVLDTDSNTILMKTMLGEERNFHTVFGVFSTGGGFNSIPREVHNQLLGAAHGMGQILNRDYHNKKKFTERK